jgi:hypothetical protein
MNIVSFHTQLLSLYEVYNESIKPLIADIETHYEKFPTPIFNEIRAFNDHIARCYAKTSNQDIIEEEITKAKSHIERILLDCYKYLNVSFFKKTVLEFERRTRWVDITTIDNGEFCIEYNRMRNGIALDLKEAKKLESRNKEEALLLYEKVYNSHNNLDDLLEKSQTKINWAIARFTTKKMLAFLAWLGAAIISGIVSSFVIPWEQIAAIFR